VTSSGNLTLGGTLSGVDLTSSVTGTLPVSNGGTGTATAFTAGSVVFAGASGVYSQDNANLFWDNTNDRLGVGTATPGYPVEVNGEVRGTKFTSSSGSQSLADNTNLAVLTLTGTGVRLFLVSINTVNSASADMTVALVAVGTNGSGGADATVTQLINGTNTDVTVSNVAGTSTVNVKQTTGITQTVDWSITRLM
jgi:hypothetical protein